MEGAEEKKMEFRKEGKKVCRKHRKVR